MGIDPLASGKNFVTLRDIAEEAGVHYSTVSLALNNHPRIPLTTRQRIQEIANRLGYQPDPMLASLSHYRRKTGKRTRTVMAWINCAPDKNYHDDRPVFAAYWKGASERAESLGFHLERFWLGEPRMTARRLDNILEARGIEALLIPPQAKAHSSLSIRWDRYFSISFGYTLEHPVLTLVTCDHAAAISLLLQKLSSLNYRRIGFHLHQELDERLHHQYEAEFYIANRYKMPQRLVPPLIYSVHSESDFAAWIQEVRPDVVVSGISKVSNWLKNLGMRIPEDIGFALTHLQSPDSVEAGIHQNDEEVGRTAVDQLAHLIHSQQRGIPDPSKRILVDIKWSPGVTVRNVSAAI